MRLATTLSLTALLLAGCGAAPTTVGQIDTNGTITTAAHETPILDIEGIGPVYAAKLQQVGITTASRLLAAGKTRTGRAHLVKQTGIPAGSMMTFVNHADLLRVTGAGPIYVRLMVKAGVDTVPELAKRRGDDLWGYLMLAQQESGNTLVNKLPSPAQCKAWVDNARNLPRFIEY